METLGSRIRTARENCNLSMRAFSKAMEIGVQTLVRYEKAGNNEKESRYPPADFLQRILDFDPSIDAAWLLTGQRSGLTYLEVNYLITRIAKIEGAEDDEKVNEILMNLYVAREMFEITHFPGSEEIEKLLGFTNGFINEIRLGRRDISELAIEEISHLVEKIIDAKVQKNPGIFNGQPEVRQKLREKKRGTSPEKPKRRKKK